MQEGKYVNSYGEEMRKRLKISKKSQESICAGVSFLIKYAVACLNVKILQNSLAKVLSREFSKILRGSQRSCSITKVVQEHIFYRARPLAVSEYLGIPIS